MHAYRSGPPPTRVAIAARTHPGAKHKSNLDAYLISDFEGYLARDYPTLSEPVNGRAAVAVAVLSGHFLDWSRNPAESQATTDQASRANGRAGGSWRRDGQHGQYAKGHRRTAGCHPDLVQGGVVA